VCVCGTNKQTVLCDVSERRRERVIFRKKKYLTGKKVMRLIPRLHGYSSIGIDITFYIYKLKFESDHFTYSPKE
jgi:hypothetical protein